MLADSCPVPVWCGNGVRVRVLGLGNSATSSHLNEQWESIPSKSWGSAEWIWVEFSILAWRILGELPASFSADSSAYFSRASFGLVCLCRVPPPKRSICAKIVGIPLQSQIFERNTFSRRFSALRGRSTFHLNPKSPWLQRVFRRWGGFQDLVYHLDCAAASCPAQSLVPLLKSVYSECLATWTIGSAREMS